MIFIIHVVWMHIYNFFFAIVGPITHSTDKLISRDNLSEQPGVSQDIQN